MLRYKNVDVNKSVFHYALAHSLESLIMKTTEIPLLVCQSTRGFAVNKTPGLNCKLPHFLD